jgi:hypothetical protein
MWLKKKKVLSIDKDEEESFEYEEQDENQTEEEMTEDSCIQQLQPNLMCCRESLMIFEELKTVQLEDNFDFNFECVISTTDDDDDLEMADSDLVLPLIVDENIFSIWKNIKNQLIQNVPFWKLDPQFHKLIDQTLKVCINKMNNYNI